MGNPYGRNVIIPLTNQSGGGVIAGDVVVVDTIHNDAFTTDTSGGFTGTVGVAQQTIGAGSVGLVALSGYVSLVNVNASVTRGHYGKTYTVAKQATDAGAARGVGTFCEFLTGGTTPDAILWPVDLLGSSLTNPMANIGDIIQGGTAGAPEALAAPLAGKVLTGAGVTTRVAYKYPPGYEFDYAELTGSVTISGTTEAAATTILTGNAVTYDGSTIIKIEAFFPLITWVQNDNTRFWLYDGSSSIGEIARRTAPTTTPAHQSEGTFQRRLTPSAAAHTYGIRASSPTGGGNVNGGAGGAGNLVPGFIRITKVSGGA